MSKPVYEIPVGDGRPSAPLNFPPPGQMPQPPSYASAPPPAPATAGGWPPPGAYQAPAAPTFDVPAPQPAPSVSHSLPADPAEAARALADFVPEQAYAEQVLAAPPIPSFDPPTFQPAAAFPPPAFTPAEAPLSVGDLSFQQEQARNGSLSADPDLIAALGEVLRLNASDLHITVNAPPMLRIDGSLRPAAPTSWSTEKVSSAIRSILTEKQQAAFDEELELDLAYSISANARFRVNIYQQRNAIGAAFRLIPTEIKQLKDLGVPESVGRFAGLPRGLVLVTGPTGSGKSTTLAALIDLVNRTRADHIVTVEDPIEFLHGNQKSLVNQREVGHDTHSFSAALKHVLRQDPDVILIGELRDLETISTALTAAETGHLVFATLHTQDAAQTIDRIIDVFPPHQQGQVRAQLAATLQGVVCQTLVKRASGQGRAVATEVLVTTPAIANLIREGKTYQVESAMQAGRELGMHTMDQHLADLVNTGQITHSAALEKVHDVETFNRLVHRTESPTPAVPGGIDFGDSFSRSI